MPYVSSKKAKQFFNVSEQTLRRWANDGQIKYKVTPGGHRRFYIKENQNNQIKQCQVIYCRVSSSKQKSDLKRQVKYMQEKFPEHEIITDVGSGINFKRKGFLSLLQRIFEGNVSKVMVSSNDRFCRFNYDFFEWLLQQFGCELVSLKKQKYESSEQELSEDIMSIITVFTARYYGKRKYNSDKKN